MKLIGSDTSPYVRKVRVVMAEKKIEYQYEQQDVWAPDSPIQQSNPLGKVPCLIMDDGGAVFDSRVIVEYLDNLPDPPHGANVAPQDLPVAALRAEAHSRLVDTQRHRTSSTCSRELCHAALKPRQVQQVGDGAVAVGG